MTFTVYYLDDEPDLRELISMYLTGIGVSVRTFSDPAEALQACRECRPDLFFIDYRLPGMSGEEVAKQSPEGLTRILISGDINARPSALFAEFLRKPFTLQSLAGLVACYGGPNPG